MKRKFIIVCSIIIVVVFVGVFTGCTALKAHSFSDDRIHRIDFVASALENTGFELSSFSENTDGFVMCGNSKFRKSQLTGIQYVGGEDAEIDVTYNSVYTQSENAVRLSAESKEVNYNETITFQPDTSVSKDSLTEPFLLMDKNSMFLNLKTRMKILWKNALYSQEF